MKKRGKDHIREDRIRNEVIVDAYGPQEQAMGWYYYLDGKMRFPFQARCIVTRLVSPLRKGETIEVRRMAPEEPAEIKRGSPLLGHDTERVFAALAGHAGSHQAPCREANRQPGEGHGSRGVLEGVRVLEIAEGISGPLCAMMLRRFGAEVTKIEPPHGDWLRKIPPLVDGESALFRELNPGKRSIEPPPERRASFGTSDHILCHPRPHGRDAVALTRKA